MINPHFKLAVKAPSCPQKPMSACLLYTYKSASMPNLGESLRYEAERREGRNHHRRLAVAIKFDCPKMA